MPVPRVRPVHFLRPIYCKLKVPPRSAIDSARFAPLTWGLAYVGRLGHRGGSSHGWQSIFAADHSSGGGRAWPFGADGRCSRPGGGCGRHGARGNHRHGDPPRGERPGHPVQHGGARIRALSDLRITNLSEFTRAVPGLYVPNQGPRSSNLMTVRGLNVSSLNDSECPGQRHGRHGRDLPRRHPAVRRPADDRHRARRGAARPAGHACTAPARSAAPFVTCPNRPEPAGCTRGIGGRPLYSINESDGIGTDLWGVVNVPLVEDHLALRLAVGYINDPGFIDYNYIVREPGVSNPGSGLRRLRRKSPPTCARRRTSTPRRHSPAGSACSGR